MKPLKIILPALAAFFLMLSAPSCRPEPLPDDVPGAGGQQDGPESPESPEPEPGPEPEPVLSFMSLWEDLYPGETTSVACRLSGGAEGRSYKIVYSSSDPTLAAVSQSGALLARKAGSVIVTASVEGTSASVQRVCHVVDLEMLKQGYDPSRVFVKGHTIYYKSVMQSWDFFDDWFYVCQVCGAPHTLSYTRKPVLSLAPQTYMHLKYYGHGDNMFVERDTEGDWLWTPNYGTLESGQTNRYADSQVLSRVKFVPGRTLLPEDSTDNYIIPGMKRIIAACDEDNGNVGIWCRNSAGKAWFYVYSLEDMKSAPEEDMQLSFSRSYGSPVVTDRPTLRARDLSKLEPKLKFQMPFNNVPQGYDYHHNKIWFMRGDGAEEAEVAAGTNKNWARVYLISPQTAKTLVQVDLPWVDDLALLRSENITDLGYFEPEGIKIKDGVLYLGFASKDAGSSPPRRVNIFKYSLD